MRGDFRFFPGGLMDALPSPVGDHAPPAPRLLLAPMEGLLDHPLREVLTAVGGIDRCVSEFIRVTDRLMPERVFTRIVPELRQGGRTLAGTPVRPQLLGSDPACMAENAAALAALGPDGIDLNFGCPAKVVNRHGGGASLLREPDELARVVAAVRRAVPARLPVSAKMRLGYEDTALMLDCARAIAASGAGELVVHARTKADGYRPPAYWEHLPAIREAVAPHGLPVVANGEIWTPADARRCRRVSGCADLMLGRGMVADPGLALRVARRRETPLPWAELLPLMQVFFAQVRATVAPRHQGGRLKQWLHYLKRAYPEADAAYAELRTVNSADELGARLFGPFGPVDRIGAMG